MSNEPIEYIKHISEECSYMISACRGLSKDAFLNDETLKRAGMRDRLIHHYIGVNYSMVWDVIKNKIPKLNDQIQEVLSKE